MTRPSVTHLASRRGFTMIEAVVAMALVTLTLVAALQAVGASGLAQQSTSDRSRGHLLAQQLLDEILQQDYIDKTLVPGGFGLEAGEFYGTNRTGHDDVDDYHGWIASPPQSRDGTVMDELAGWSRTVSVEWVQPLTPNQVVGYDSHLKRITVSVTHNSRPVAELTALRGAGWHQPFDDLIAENNESGGSELTVLVEAFPASGFMPLDTMLYAEAYFDDVLIDSMLLTWKWTFGDGNAGTGNSVSHVYWDQGVYTATVVVSAPDGKDGSASVTITVEN